MEFDMAAVSKRCFSRILLPPLGIHNLVKKSGQVGLAENWALTVQAPLSCVDFAALIITRIIVYVEPVWHDTSFTVDAVSYYHARFVAVEKPRRF